MTVLPPEIWVRRIFQHSRVPGWAAAAGVSHLSIRPSIPPFAMILQAVKHRQKDEIVMETLRIVMEMHDFAMHSTLGKAYEIKCDATINIFENTLGT
jgi:hypothetical protein